MKVSVRAAAPEGPPETGTSAKEPWVEAVTAAEMERDVETGMVLQSMKSFWLGGFGGMERRPVVGEVKTWVTWLPDGSMVMMISWMVGLVSDVAPFFFGGLSLERLTLCRETSLGVLAMVISPGVSLMNLSSTDSTTSHMMRTEVAGIFDRRFLAMG